MSTSGASINQSEQYIQFTYSQSLAAIAILDKESIPQFDVDNILKIQRAINQSEHLRSLEGVELLHEYLISINDCKFKEDKKLSEYDTASLIDSAHISYFALKIERQFNSEECTELEILEELEKSKGSIRLNRLCDYRFLNDRTMLHLAVINRKHKVLDWFIKYYDNRESKLHIEDKHGNTLLHQAVKSINTNAILILRRAHADPDRVNDRNQRPIDLARGNSRLIAALEYTVSLTPRSKNTGTIEKLQSRFELLTLTEDPFKSPRTVSSPTSSSSSSPRTDSTESSPRTPASESSSTEFVSIPTASEEDNIRDVLSRIGSLELKESSSWITGDNERDNNSITVNKILLTCLENQNKPDKVLYTNQIERFGMLLSQISLNELISQEGHFQLLYEDARKNDYTLRAIYQVFQDLQIWMANELTIMRRKAVATISLFNEELNSEILDRLDTLEMTNSKEKFSVPSNIKYFGTLERLHQYDHAGISSEFEISALVFNAQSETSDHASSFVKFIKDLIALNRYLKPFEKIIGYLMVKDIQGKLSERRRQLYFEVLSKYYKLIPESVKSLTREELVLYLSDRKILHDIYSAIENFQKTGVIVNREKHVLGLVNSISLRKLITGLIKLDQYLSPEQKIIGFLMVKDSICWMVNLNDFKHAIEPAVLVDYYAKVHNYFNNNTTMLFDKLININGQNQVVLSDNLKMLDQALKKPPFADLTFNIRKALEELAKNKAKNSNILKHIVDEIRKISLQAYHSITLQEFENEAWEKPDKESLAENIVRQTKLLDNLTSFVCLQIMSARTVKEMTRRFHLWVVIANTLLKPEKGLGPDLRSVVAIMSALQCKAMEMVVAKISSKTREIFLQLVKLCEPQMSKQVTVEVDKSYLGPLHHLGLLQTQLSMFKAAKSTLTVDDNLHELNCRQGQLLMGFVTLQRAHYEHPIVFSSDLRRRLSQRFMSLKDMYYVYACKHHAHSIVCVVNYASIVCEQLTDCIEHNIKPILVSNKSEIKDDTILEFLSKYLLNDICNNRLDVVTGAKVFFDFFEKSYSQNQTLSFSTKLIAQVSKKSSDNAIELPYALELVLNYSHYLFERNGEDSDTADTLQKLMKLYSSIAFKIVFETNQSIFQEGLTELLKLRCKFIMQTKSNDGFSELDINAVIEEPTQLNVLLNPLYNYKRQNDLQFSRSRSVTTSPMSLSSPGTSSMSVPNFRNAMAFSSPQPSSSEICERTRERTPTVVSRKRSKSLTRRFRDSIRPNT